MPNLQRSPSKDQSMLNKPIIPVHYNSDSALNVSTMGISSSQESINCYNISKRQKRSEPDDPSTSNVDIITLFNSKFDEMNTTLTSIQSQNQAIQMSMENMTRIQQQLLSKMDGLERENLEYKTRIIQLERKLDDLEKKSVSTSLEIRNLPKQKDENKISLVSTIKKICLSLAVPEPLADMEIRDIFRTKPETIVVDFTTTTRKENVIQHYINFNKTKREQKEPLLNSDHLSLPGPTRPIYISDHLTSKARRLFYLARENVKNKKLVAAWTSYGRIYVKKDEGSTPIRITEESVLQQVSL